MVKHIIPLLLFIGLAWGEKTTVAVLEFNSEELENVSSSALASIVRREISKASGYILIDRNSMNEILVEQGLTQSGCISSECAVEVGKLLGVQQMINGTLSSLGSLYLLDINIIDVSTGKIIKTETLEHIGKIEELIHPLRKTIQSMIQGSIMDINQAFVYIESVPSGAMVYINNISSGSTPLKYKIDALKYNITLKAEGYSDWVQEINGELGETKIVKAELLESRPSSTGEISSNEIGKWEVLGISRNDYITFLRIGIDERDWIENLQPEGITINDIIEFNNNNIPRNHWLMVKNGTVSLEILKNLLDNNIGDKHLSFCIENNISGESARKLIDNKILPSKWIDYLSMRENYGNNQVPINKMEIYYSFLYRIKWFSTEEIIDINSYKELENTFGSDYFKLLTINGSFIPDSLLLKISDYFLIIS